MKNEKLLLLSSSRVKETEYLAHALPMIKSHLGEITELLFIPFAGVTMSYDEYATKVQSALTAIGIKVTSIHTFEDPIAAIQNAQAIAVGGGNTFHLLHQLYQLNLLEAMQTKVSEGTPYIGWSAGSNIAGTSIRTTNDMPIIEPKSFNALNLVPFQLNPHYTDQNPPGHNGETRAQRLAEFMVLNKEMPIVAIVEGTALKVENNTMRLIGGENGFVFKGGNKSVITTECDLDHLL